MQVYTITSVVNSDNFDCAHGAAGTWYEVFSKKEDAISLIEKWGGQPVANKEDVFLLQQEKNGKVFYFYYTINTQYFGGVAS